MGQRKITGEIRKYFETNENENTVYQNAWDAVEAVLRGKFLPVNAYIRKEEESQIYNLNLYLKELEKNKLT